jgi:hypothetical protein
MSMIRVFMDLIPYTAHPFRMQYVYDREFQLSNAEQCAVIARNLRMAIASGNSLQKEFSFLPSERTWLALNSDCFHENRDIQTYMQTRGIKYKYQIMYQLQRPYTIEYDHENTCLSIRQPV